MASILKDPRAHIWPSTRQWGFSVKCLACMIAMACASLLAGATGCKRQQSTQKNLAQAASPRASSRPAPRRSDAPAARRKGHNINERFLKPGASARDWKKRFESNKREVFTARGAIIKKLGLKPGQSVADLGAGTGVHLKPILDQIGAKGTLYAVELAPIFVKFLQKMVRTKGYPNVKVIKSSSSATNLPAASVDLIFVCATYHHFDQPVSMLKDISRALRPGGRLAIVDFKRIPGVSSKWLLNHVKHNQEQVIKQVTQNGFKLDKLVKMKALKENYFLMFSKK